MDCNDYIIYIIRLYKHLALKEENIKEELQKEEDKNIKNITILTIKE
jgi:hypothetical protein